jgi:hypothetical protein
VWRREGERTEEEAIEEGEVEILIVLIMVAALTSAGR